MFSTAEIDECDGENDCHENANCTNTIGSYNCSCNDGFEGNSTHCQGIADVFVLFVYLFVYLFICQ